MKTTTARAATPDLEGVRSQIEHWRRTRPSSRSRMPDALWHAAVALCEGSSVHAVSQRLGLGYDHTLIPSGLPNPPGPYTLTTSQSYDSGLTCGDWWASTANASGPMVVSDPDPPKNGFDGELWNWEILGPSCADYQVQEVSFYYIDGTNQGWVGNSFLPRVAPCIIATVPVSGPPPPGVPSSNQMCSPGTADFELVILTEPYGRLAEKLVRWTPVAQSAVTLPERAWITKIEVTDWGSASNLHVSTTDPFYFVHNGPKLQGTTVLHSAVSPSELTFDVGDVPFLATLGSESVDMTDMVSFANPTVAITWDCSVDIKNPHYAAPVNMTGYAGALPGALGTPHRFVVWVMDDFSEARFALEGRFSDYIDSPLQVVSGGHSFEFHVESFGITVAGHLTSSDGVYSLGELSYSSPGADESTLLESIALTALPE